jgi:hypothetical protein
LAAKSRIAARGAGKEAAICLKIAAGYAELASSLEAKTITARRDDKPAETIKAGDPAEATKASHEVMGLMRGNSALSHLVLRLRESGLSWRELRAAIQAEINGRASC